MQEMADVIDADDPIDVQDVMDHESVAMTRGVLSHTIARNVAGAFLGSDR